MNPSVPTVAICIPSKDEWKADMAVAFGGMIAWTRARVPLNLAIHNRKGAMISDQRNSIVELCLKENFDYILWLDSDMVFPPQTLQGLLARDKDIVGATYNRRLPPYETLGHWVDKTYDLSKGGLIEADFLPGGVMLVKTEVYRKLGFPYYFETYNWRGGSELDQFFNMLDDITDAPMPESLRSKLHSAKELREWLVKSRAARLYQYGSMISEDNNFCRRARKAGFQLWCDLDLTYKVSHIGEQHVQCRPALGQTVAEAQTKIDSPKELVA